MSTHWILVVIKGDKQRYRLDYDKLLDADGQWDQELLRDLHREKAALSCMCHEPPVPMHVRRHQTKRYTNYALVTNPKCGEHVQNCPRYNEPKERGNGRRTRVDEAAETRTPVATNVTDEFDLLYTKRNIILPTLDQLNPQQQAAATHTRGPCLVVAAAGSGKTATIIKRISYLVTRGVPPYKILASTFTNRAAKEMQGRINKELGAEKGNKVSVNTLHSVAHRMVMSYLREEWSVLQNPFYVLDQAMEESSDYNPYGTGIKMSPFKALEQISLHKGNGVRPNSEELGDDIRRIYQAYEDIKEERKWLDLDDMILKATDLLIQDAEFAEKWQRSWTYVVVDDFQDTNLAQWQMVQQLVKQHKNIMVTGDDWQSICGRRGGWPKLMQQFLQTYSDARKIVMETNYRCCPNIIYASNQVIKLNESVQIPKTVRAGKAMSNDAFMDVLKASSDEVEAEVVVQELKELHEDYPELPWSEYAILLGTYVQVRIFEESFLDNNIPYEIVGGGHFYENRDVQTILNYLRTAIDTSDPQIWVPLLNKPKRYIPKRVVQEVREGGWDVLIQHPKCRTFVLTIEELRKQPTPDKAIEWLIRTETGVIREQDDDEPIKWVDSLVQAASKHDTIADFLSFVDWVIEKSKEPKQDGVQLMTIHGSKGLEFDTVFVVGMVEGVLPHNKSLKESDMHEETRLCYVAMTRAKNKLYLLSAMEYVDNPVRESRYYTVAKRAMDEFDEQMKAAKS